jgi:hypothetical protein
MARTCARLLILSALVIGCSPQSARPPVPPPDKECEAACNRRIIELACPQRVPMDVATCTSRCERAEALRPLVTHASCLATALSCQEQGECAGK